MALVAAATLLLFAACDKEKTCRCSVFQSTRVRIIKIAAGNCEDIHTYQYHTELDSLRVEQLLCTDFEFDIDTIFNEQ